MVYIGKLDENGQQPIPEFRDPKLTEKVKKLIEKNEAEESDPEERKWYRETVIKHAVAQEAGVLMF